ncbi:MAG: acylphosphatase [Actinomycetota bacterium]
MDLARAHVVVSGRVQGVYYRSYAADAARELGITGWVMNTPGGDVEAVFEGDRGAVDRMIDWCWRGSPSSRVDDVRVTWEEATGELEGFDVRYRNRGGV